MGVPFSSRRASAGALEANPLLQPEGPWDTKPGNGFCCVDCSALRSGFPLAIQATISLASKHMDANNSSPVDVSNIHLEPLNSLEDLQNSVCRALYSFWKTIEEPEAFQSTDLINVPEALPYLVLIEVEEATETFKVRMEGAQLASVSKRDYTGKTLEMMSRETPLTYKFCKAIMDQKIPVYTRDSFQDEHGGMIYLFEETIAAPVLNAAGVLIRVLLVHGPRI